MNSEQPISPPRRPLWRRIVRGVLAIPTALIVLSMIVLIAAQVIRDHNLVLAFLMYVPLWPVAVAAVGWDLLLLGTALPLRFLLLCLGVGTGILSFGMMWSPKYPPEGDPQHPSIRILQWNTQWGGREGQTSLDGMVDEMLRRTPDVLCLSEAPSPQWMHVTWSRRLNNDQPWYVAWVDNRGVVPYWYRMLVISRFPVRLVEDHPLVHGRAAVFEIDSPVRPLRLMMVDVQSQPSVPRSPSLFQVAELLNRFAAAGRPVDVVAGDFNTPARFRGVDALSAAGDRYDRAALWSGQWRATWPSWLRYRGRLYHDLWRISGLDIDHIFIRRTLDVAAAEIFTADGTDHRGQTATIQLSN